MQNCFLHQKLFEITILSNFHQVLGNKIMILNTLDDIGYHFIFFVEASTVDEILQSLNLIEQAFFDKCVYVRMYGVLRGGSLLN